MLRVAIVGCGKIADQHAAALGRIADARLVATCDRELLMARQLAERFGNARSFGDVNALFAEAAPDVVHITTPPQSHFQLAKQAMEAGCHVYLEKPFTVTEAEARDLFATSNSLGLCLTAGHNLQFTLEMLEMRRLVASGFLGGQPVHLESHFPYSLADANYVGPVLGNRNHWVRQLPGQLLHNVMSHGIAKLAEFLNDDPVEVVAKAHQSPRLKSLGGQEVLDELRVLIRDSSGTTAYFCFSTQLRPGVNQLRIFGPNNSITVDHGSGCCFRHGNKSCKSYLTYFLPPLRTAGENLRNAVLNATNFAARKLHQDFGMKELIERFYRSIRKEAPAPIPQREILLTAKLMDEIFAQIYPRPRAGADLPQLPVHRI